MTARWEPERVAPELVELTRALGDPARDLVILAEGNTSEAFEDGTIAVKASGARMDAAGPDDFVVVDVAELVSLMLADDADQAVLTAALDAGEHAGARRRASIETLVHVAVRHFAPVRYVAHTHPTAVVSLLASVHAEHAFDETVYSDELVVLGTPLFVPYAQPGIALGREFFERLRGHVDAHGALPSLVLLGNHGIVAISESSAGALAVSEMAVKSARVRTGALAVGGIAGLSAQSTAAYFDREDFRERRSGLAGRV
ncbi:class II aldolase [Agromyces intestinalis]|uniref:Class II aldolase n=1 Tax=Agromyces intestinalis TaxID=2592652 RepID=A0A5C1YFJ5_9MICO|nr:class II aldolase/adducin family protein [Agromyces intestinalis]QEO14250.1 class II aldolase [Agromyces intestinalis]